MNPRAVAFDLDGTLAPSKAPLEPFMGPLLIELTEHLPVAVMSGGSFAQFERQFLTGIPESDYKNLYLFPTNATQCLTWEGGAWVHVYDNPFTSDEKEMILNALHEALAETGFDKPPERLWGPQIEDRESQISWSALGQQAPYEFKKVWDPDRKKRTPLAEALMRRLPDLSVRMNASNTIDITKAGMTKAYGVRRWSEILSIPIADMLYIGDALFPGGNDEVVKETGIPTHQVKDPTETADVIRELIHNP
jgi:phosphomannomutase